jgi:uncharacterized protein (TIGR02569 family)
VTDGPPAGVLAAFGLTGTPARLPGGQGACWRAGQVVLKPDQDPAEGSWLAEVFAELTGPGFRVPRPVRAADGAWVVEGWAGWAWVDGEPDPLPRWRELIAVSRAFHRALAGRGRPRWANRGSSVWAAADRVAWGEASAVVVPELADLVDGPLAALRPVRLASQLMHGDIAGNVLFAGGQAAGQAGGQAAGQTPAVIDFSPYWRPPGYALAVAAVDLLTWSGAPPAILDELAGEPELDQLLLRALVFRTVTESLARDRPDQPHDPGRDGELAAVRRVTEPVTKLLLARAAVLDSGP